MVNAKEFRVYFVPYMLADENQHFDIENFIYYEQRHEKLSQKAEEFISYCEDKGNVYSLSEYVMAFNRKETDNEAFIYITNRY